MAIGLLEDPGDVHVQDPLFFIGGERFDKILTRKDPVEIAFVKDLVSRTGKSHTDPGNGHGTGVKTEPLHLSQGIFPFAPEKLLMGQGAHGLDVLLKKRLEVVTVRRRDCRVRGRNTPLRTDRFRKGLGV